MCDQIARWTGLFVACLVFGLSANRALAESPTILFEGDSIYNHITVTDNGRERCMVFGRRHGLSQTCIAPDTPDEPLFEYSEMMFASFLFQPAPRRIALLGLGGGYLPLVFRTHLSQVRLDVVEVDPLVIRLAGDYFAFAPAGTIAIHTADGRQYLKRQDTRYDQIWIDVFNSDYIPTHMTTREFLQLVKARLTTGGLVAQNCFGDNRLFDAQLATFRAVFHCVYVFRGEQSWNTVLIATDQPPLSTTALAQQATRLGGHIGKVNLQRQLLRLDQEPVTDGSPILTDDYAPANLWAHRKGGK